MAEVSAYVGSDKYDVSVAIPTSEEVSGSVTASDMSWYYSIIKMSDSKSYTINGIRIYYNPRERIVRNSSGEIVRRETRWDSDTVSVEGTYSTHYFGVQSAELNSRSSASVSNSAVGTIATLGSANVTGSLTRDGGIVFEESLMNTSSFSSYGDTRSAAISNAKSTIADRIREASYVKNDSLTMNGTTVLSGVTERGEQFGGTPYDYPSSLTSPSSGKDTASGKKVIPEDKLNTIYASSASARYVPVAGFDGRPTYTKSASPSAIVVHTPVVNMAEITQVSDFINQKINIDSSKIYLMLDKDFTITIPNDGVHRTDARGYGARTYNSYQATTAGQGDWGKIKDVKLPFDAYLHQGEERILVSANKWLSELGLATATNTYTFTIPVWAQEGVHTIETRVIAENAPSNDEAAGEGANLLMMQYVASKDISVEIIGKIYDLRISSTNDPAWEEIKGEDGRNYIVAEEFPFGQEGQNANTVYRFAPKLGYSIGFDFKTKGIKSNNVDISVQPEGFYFVSKDGGQAEEVDLYYHTVNNSYVKIEPGNENVNLIVNLSNSYMKVPIEELMDSIRIMKEKIGVSYTYSQNVNIGSFPTLKVPENLRLCYDNFAEYVGSGLYRKSQSAISEDAKNGFIYDTKDKWSKLLGNGEYTTIASVGHWHVAYRLPASTVVVDKGVTREQLINNPDLAKTGGYVLVKFDIVTNYDEYPYLKYDGPESLSEGGEYIEDEDGVELDWDDGDTNHKITLPNGEPADVPIGTVGIFDVDLRSTNDYETEGTH